MRALRCQTLGGTGGVLRARTRRPERCSVTLASAGAVRADTDRIAGRAAGMEEHLINLGGWFRPCGASDRTTNTGGCPAIDVWPTKRICETSDPALACETNSLVCRPAFARRQVWRIDARAVTARPECRRRILPRLTTYAGGAGAASCEPHRLLGLPSPTRASRSPTVDSGISLSNCRCSRGRLSRCFSSPVLV